jgi:hypothetical protein
MAGAAARLAFAVALWACVAATGRADPIDVGPPLAVVTLRISAADDAGFLHDLSDYLNRYGFVAISEPGGAVVGTRPVFLAWFRRDDGVTLLVTDFAGPERMQAFFYGRKDGTAGEQTADLAQAYTAKMSSYPAYTAATSGR